MAPDTAPNGGQDRITDSAAPLAHTPVPSCEDPKRPACLACTDAADRCVPWPCEHATVAFTDVVEGCTCDECMEGEL